MKTIYFNIQSKGGAGKSMLTYLQALKNEQNEQSCFVDLDSSTKTSARQLKFLTESDRLFEIDIYNETKKIEREKLFEVIEELADTGFAEIYMDFGAPESEQIPALFELDYSVEEFKEFETGLGMKFVFNVVVAGGPAYTSCIEYLRKMAVLIGGRFEICCYLNEHSFLGNQKLLEEAMHFVSLSNGAIKVREFGDIQTDRSSGQVIMGYMAQGKGFSNYETFTAKAVMRRVLAKI